MAAKKINNKKEVQAFKLGDLVQVEWDDIVTFGGWDELGDSGLVEYANPHSCVSVGYITKMADSFTVISATKGVNEKRSSTEYNQSITIPTGCIKKIVAI